MTDAITTQLDAAINERDSAVTFLMDALLYLPNPGDGGAMKFHDAASIELFHKRVGELLLRIDASDAKRRADGTLR